MAIKQYTKHRHEQVGFIQHLSNKPYLKVLATIAWSFTMFALALNLSVSYFGDTVGSRELAFEQPQEEIIDGGQVQGVITEMGVPSPTPASTLVDEQKDIIENTARTPRKTSFKIALYGDSMIDTLGTKLTTLQNILKKKYPKTTFTFYNYGVGAENAEQGLNRFDKPLVTSDRNYPPLSSLGADIIVLDSYAYNPFNPFDRDKHWINLSKLVEKAKETDAEVYLLADIAPVRAEFGRGPKGVNWDTVTAYEKSGQVIQLLENTVGISKNLNVILVNAFEKSTVTVRGDGKREYVSAQDGVHPSEVGQKFIAEQIANTLVLD